MTVSENQAAHAHGTGQDGAQPGWTTAVTMLQDASPFTVPDGASAMTISVEWEPGDPGSPPHRHPGPAFGYVIEGAVRFELEGEPERLGDLGESCSGHVAVRLDPSDGRTGEAGLLAELRLGPAAFLASLPDDGTEARLSGHAHD